MSTPPRIDSCQRWELRRATYRPAREVVSTRHLEVVPVSREIAKAFVELHHYSGSFPAAMKDGCHALYDRGELAGVAVFSRPFNELTITNTFPTFDRATDGVELGRFVLLDGIGANAETWFLSRAFAAIGELVRGVVSFSDPLERASAAGEVVMPGHVGTIYQAFNARYRGLSGPATIRLLPDGTQFSNFSSGKIRRWQRGGAAAIRELVAHGATPIDPEATPAARIEWLEYWRDALTRPVRHPGNHRYTWRLDRAPLEYGPLRAYPKKGRAV